MTMAKKIASCIETWLKEHHKSLSRMECAFLHNGLKTNEHPFACFYLTLKAHKLKPGQGVDDLKSRPIVSCPGSLLHPLGIWVDRKLQEVAKSQTSYFHNSLDLKQSLTSLQLPHNVRLFTADAISMYTNIPTNFACPTISRYL
jgi:hypothetical protein